MRSDEQRKSFVRNLKKIMDRQRITQTDLAAKTKRPLSTISSWYNGQSYPRVNAMQDIADALGVSMVDLISEEERESAYYYDPETAALAKELHNNPRLRVLMSSSRKTTPEELEALIKIVEGMTEDD